MVMIGDNIKINHKVRTANTIDSDEWYIESTDEISLRATTKCPHCKKTQMPLRKKNTKYYGTTYPWCGCDHQDVEQHYTSKCTKCNKTYKFGLFFSQ